MTSIKQLIEEYIGPRCDEYEPGCVVCDTWQEYDTLVKHQKDHAMEEEMRRFVNWMNTLPLENQTTLMKALISHTPARLNTHAATEWANRNGATVMREQREKEEMDKFRAEEKAAKRGPWATPRSFKAASEARRAKPVPSEYGWVFDENGKERPITKEEHDAHEAEREAMLNTEHPTNWTPEQLKTLEENIARVTEMSGRGPGRGKSDFIKDIPGVKVTKLKKARKLSTKGFQTKK